MRLERWFSTSKYVDPETSKQGRKTYEINTRSCIDFREITKGLEGLRSVCKNMNIPPPMQPNALNNIYNTLHSSYTEIANESMQIASKEIQVEEDGDKIKYVIASFDGTWQKRGYASLNGVVAAIHMVKLLILKLCQKFVFRVAIGINQGGKTHLDLKIGKENITVQ